MACFRFDSHQKHFLLWSDLHSMEVTVKPYTVQQVIYCWPIVLCSNQWVRPLKVKPSRRCKHPVLGHGAQPHSHADQPVAHDALDLSSECAQKSQETEQLHSGTSASLGTSFDSEQEFFKLESRAESHGIALLCPHLQDTTVCPKVAEHFFITVWIAISYGRQRNTAIVQAWPCMLYGAREKRQYCRHRQGIVLRTASEHASVACHGLQKMYTSWYQIKVSLHSYQRRGDRGFLLPSSVNQQAAADVANVCNGPVADQVLVIWRFDSLMREVLLLSLPQFAVSRLDNLTKWLGVP